MYLLEGKMRCLTHSGLTNCQLNMVSRKLVSLYDACVHSSMRTAYAYII